MKKYFFMLILLFGFSGYANAEPNVYIGGGMGFTSFDGQIEGIIHASSEDMFHDIPYGKPEELSSEDVTGKVFGGFRFSKYSAIEIAFHRFGGPAGENSQASIDDFNRRFSSDLTAEQIEDSYDVLGLSGSFLGIIPLTKTFEVFAKVGLLHSWATATTTESVDEVVELKLGKTATGAVTETGFTVLVGGGAIFNITENLSLRAEVEWAPDIVNNHSDKSKRIYKKINQLWKAAGQAGKLDYDVDLNILSTTASVVWHF